MDFLWLMVALYFVGSSGDRDILSSSKILSRKRRYVSFPEGSSFSVATEHAEAKNGRCRPWINVTNLDVACTEETVSAVSDLGVITLCAGCMTVGVIGQPAPTTAPGTFSFGLNWGIAYELPNTTETARFYRKKYRKPIAQRRSRRELYEKLELILDNMGYGGRQCILKTLCETTQRLVPHGGNMIEEIFRTLFTLPMAKILPTEPLAHTIYDSAHRLGVLMDNCDQFLCPLSLVDWAQGYYNAPVPKLDMAKNPWSLFSSSFG